MATAGSGDVLTGIFLSLLAQGYAPGAASLLGTYLHGLAGNIAAENLCEESLIASDIISHLHSAFKKLKQAKRDTPKGYLSLLAGMARFELTDDGVKVRCLTAWLHPYIKIVKPQRER